MSRANTPFSRRLRALALEIAIAIALVAALVVFSLQHPHSSVVGGLDGVYLNKMIVLIVVGIGALAVMAYHKLRR